MSKRRLISLENIDGFDENGNPIDVEPQETDVTETTETTEVTDAPVEVTVDAPADQPVVIEDKDIRVIEDQPVVQAEPLPEEEQTVNEEIDRETVAIEELEATVEDSDQQQQNVDEVSVQVEDTLNDVRPALDEGGISNESINMIHSLRRRIKRTYGHTLGNESFETIYAVESFGFSKSVRLSTSRKLVDALANEATDLSQTLKNVVTDGVKKIIDLLYKLVNYVDLAGRKAKSLKDRVSKATDYKEGVEFESQRIANAFVKNTNGETYAPKEFAALVSSKSDETTKIGDVIADVLKGSVPLITKISNQAKQPVPNDAELGALDSVKTYFSTKWQKLTGPKLASGQVFVGLKLDGDFSEGLTKESVEAKNDTFKTPSISELNAILDLVVKSSENIKKARSSFGDIYKAKSSLSTIASATLTQAEKGHPGGIRDEFRQACNEMVKQGRDQLNALKDLTTSCSKGVGILNSYVDLCLSKGSKKSKSEVSSEAK